jgi:hypothetical protein
MWFLTFLFFLFHNALFSGSVENPYLVYDLLQRAIANYRKHNAYFSMQPFMMIADKAYNNCFRRTPFDRVGLYELGGQLNLIDLDLALQANGTLSSTLLKPEWIVANLKIPIHLNGRIETSGIGFQGAYEFIDNWLFEGSLFVMNSHQILHLRPEEENKNFQLNESYLRDIFNLHRQYTSLLRDDKNPSPLCSSNTSFSDIIFAVRYENAYDYWCYLKRFKWHSSLGMLIGAAHQKNYDIIPDIGLGIESKLGGFFELGGNFVLKEDVTIDLLGRVNLYIPYSHLKRISLKNEPLMYGSLKTVVNVDPGSTWYFSPGLIVEGLRDGLGAKIAYSIASHQKDKWKIESDNDNIKLEPNLDLLQQYSGWTQEHFVLSVFYDFMRDSEEHFFEPFIGFTAHIPVDWFFAKGAARSFGLSLILETIY